MHVIHSKEHPALVQAVQLHMIRWDSQDCEWVGVAEDGIEVSLGSSDEFANRYLQNNLNPKDW